MNIMSEQLNQSSVQLIGKKVLKLSIKSMIRRLCDALAQKVRNDYSLQTNGSSEDKQNKWWRHGHFLWSSIPSSLYFLIFTSPTTLPLLPLSVPFAQPISLPSMPILPPPTYSVKLISFNLIQKFQKYI